MRAVVVLGLLGCGSSTHAVDGSLPADVAVADAPADAAAAGNHWTFNGNTYTSPTVTCELPSAPYWFIHGVAIETSGHELAVYFLYPHPPAAGTYDCIGNPNMMVAGQAVIAAGDAPNGVYYATGGQLVATVTGGKVTATFADVPTELGSSGMFSSISGTATCPSP